MTDDEFFDNRWAEEPVADDEPPPEQDSPPVSEGEPSQEQALDDEQEPNEQAQPSTQESKQADFGKQAEYTPMQKREPPNLDDFDLDTDEGLAGWLKAQEDYEKQAELDRLEELMQEREKRIKEQQRQVELENQFKNAFENRPNFKENFGNLIKRHEQTPFPVDVSEVFDGDELIDVLEMLASDENLYNELAGLSEKKALLRLGALQASKRTVVSKSNAPKPPSHTKSNGSIKTDIHQLSDDEFFAARGL